MFSHFSQFDKNIIKLVVIKDYECGRHRNFNKDTLMISVSDFQPLSIDKINIFSSTTRALQKDISVTKSTPF